MADWNPRVNELFFKLFELADPAARHALLAEECAGDAELFRAVESLLNAHDQAGRFLEHPELTSADTGTYPDRGLVDRTLAPADLPGHDDSVGTSIGGKYLLVEKIGAGGMGNVYRAQQTEPVRRDVAVKVIKAGMDSKAVLARFETERQALAIMDHPNIARVFDGGTTSSGQPFFVMELVKGVPITEFCDARRLTPRQRLELFVPICQAIQHAHQKGVIHRDIKPSNLLVTLYDDRPVAKVIDFGVAKATEQRLTDLSFADVGVIVGTPAYMSPEQADPTSMDIDTRTDVYGLGVILYELLAGSPPIDAKRFRRGAILEMLRMVREVEPPKPSTRVSTADALPSIAATRGVDPAQLKRALAGDLDWIVMKALEKDRARRYDTANGLAADVMRHLAHEPVLAAPPSRTYRLRKFVRKNRAAAMAASFVALSLLGGIGGVTWALIEARQQAEIARAETSEKEKARLAEADRAEGERLAKLEAQEHLNTLGQLIKKIQVQLGRQPGTQELSRELLETAMNGLKTFTDSAAGKERRNMEEPGHRMGGDAYFKMAEISNSLGNVADAHKYGRIYYEMAQSLLKDNPDNERLKLDIALACRFLGQISQEQGDPIKALGYYQTSLELHQQLAAVPLEERLRRNEKVKVKDRLYPRAIDLQLSEAYTRVGLTTYYRGDSAHAKEPILKSLAIRQNLADATARDLATWLVTVNPGAPVTLLGVAGRLPALLEQMKGDRQNLARNHHLLGEIYFRLRNLEKSRFHYEMCKDMREADIRDEEAEVKRLAQMGKPRSPDLRLVSDLAQFDESYGAMLFSLGAPSSEVVSLLDRSIALCRRVLESDKGVAVRMILARSLYARGAIGVRSGERTLAAKCFDECLGIREEIAKKGLPNYRNQLDLLEVLARAGAHQKAVELAEKLREEHAKDSKFLICTARAYAQASLAVLNDASLRGQYREMALAALQTALELGYTDTIVLETNADLDPVRESPGFKKLMEKVSKQ
jgi:serine/threonine protein kinase/tetratricopeptide (TPR) repeat protein